MRLAGIFAIATLAACAGSEEAAPTAKPMPTPTPTATPATAVAVAMDAAAEKPPEALKKNATPTIASVTLVQDCNGKVVGAPRSGGYTKPDSKMKAKRARGSGPLRQPCSQSMLQLAFAGQGPQTAQVTLGEIRLKSSSGKVVATLATRNPTIWHETNYQGWDGILPANADSKSSYMLSMPNWGEVETAIGGSSFNHMFTVEVDVTIGDETTTVESPQVERSRPMMIKT